MFYDRVLITDGANIWIGELYDNGDLPYWMEGNNIIDDVICWTTLPELPRPKVESITYVTNDNWIQKAGNQGLIK